MVSRLREQEDLVYTFFGSGSLMVESKGSETESNVLIAGTRNPFKIKVEIVHPWGRPLLDILIQDSKINILCYPEKRVYRGPVKSLAPSRFFPGSLDPDQIWSFLRGYPVLRRYDHAIPLKENRIAFLNREKEIVQVIGLYKESDLPRFISFPGQGTKTLFSDYETRNGIYYAHTIRLDDSGNETMVELGLKEVVFNEPIPEAIFAQKVLPGFEVVRLKVIEEE